MTLQILINSTALTVCQRLARALWLAVLVTLALGAYASPDHDHTAATSDAPPAKRKMCEEHALPEVECGICHPDAAKKLKPGQGIKVRLPAADSASLVGVELAQAKVGPIAESVECYAELAFNQNRLAQIAAPVGGIRQSVEVDVGAKVEE